MTTPNDIVEAILTGKLYVAQEALNEAVAEAVKQKIDEQRPVIAAEVFGTSIVEDCGDKKKPPFGKKDSDDSDKDEKDDKEGKDSDKDSDKDDKSDKKPPFGKKDD